MILLDTVIYFAVLIKRFKDTITITWEGPLSFRLLTNPHIHDMILCLSHISLYLSLLSQLTIVLDLGHLKIML